MPQLFDRYGQPRTPNGTNDKGVAVFREHRPCLRCGGTGIYANYGVCYRCGGARNDPAGPFTSKLYTTEKLAQLNATAAKRQAKKEAAHKVIVDEKRALLDVAWGLWYADNKPACDNVFEARIGGEYFHSLIRELAAKIIDRVPLSDKAIDTALGMIVSRYAEQDQREASRHVGTIGERIDMELYCERVMMFQSSGFPRITTYINLCHDRVGNRIVYKGSNAFEQDVWFKCKATIKDHDHRGDEAQTLIARPKVIEAVQPTGETSCANT